MAGAAAVDAATAPLMAAEDFAFMLEEKPGAYLFLGNGPSAGLHHPAYDFADSAIAYGASFWVRLVERALPLATYPPAEARRATLCPWGDCNRPST